MPFIASIDIIIECHSGRLGAIAKLPDNTVANILNFGDHFKVVSLCLKKGFCAPIGLINISDDIGLFGLKCFLKAATHKVIKVLNKFARIFVESRLDQLLKSWKGMYNREFTPKEPLIRYDVG